MDLWGNDLRVDQVSEAIKGAADSAQWRVGRAPCSSVGV